MQQRFDIHTAPVPPFRAETRHSGMRDAEGHIRGVEATSGGLIRATIGAALAAGAILVFAWLPAEHGIDPTGVGRALGLTEMGQIKQQLYAEAAADDAAAAAAASQSAPAAAPAPVDPALTERLDAIEAHLAAIVAIVGAAPAPSARAEAADAPEVAAAREQAAPTASPPLLAEETTSASASVTAPAAAPVWRDEVSYTLAPAEGIEVKLVMEEGAVAAFEWTANGSVLNYDTHGDGGGQKISYEQGRGVPGQDGELVAAFAGNHGWFWRNRTDAPVTVTLRTRGDYAQLKVP